jgi:hypothetical protein
LIAASASAQTPSAVAPYEAVTDRTAYREPALPALGPAGSTFRDPVFKSTITRVTDAMTRPGTPNRSYRTPSSPHQNTWSAKSSYFYVIGSNGAGAIPFAFDPSTGTARRIQPSGSGEGGMVLKFYIEPQFSYVDDAIIFGSFNGVGSTKRTIDQYDFRTGAYTTLFNLDTLAGGLANTYIGGIASSGGPVERIMAFFGGASQDRHRYVVVFDRANPQKRQVVDTVASTINGAPSPVRLDFKLHHVAIDRSGRYVMLYSTSADQTGARKAAQEYLWDLESGRITELGTAALPYGHDAFGYGTYVNKDCCTSSTWDAGQWQFRALASPLATRDLVKTVLKPQQVYMADHTTWNNARPDRLLPVVSGTYRFGANTTPWRAWDDEIVAIQTDAAGAESTIWRFAHHRSDVSYDGDASRVAFWYQPHPNISQDGRWVLFTSNWEKTLGVDPVPEPGTAARQDVFLLELKQSGTGAREVSRPVMAIDAPGPHATVLQPFAISGWAIDAGSARDNGVDMLHVWGFPNPGSGQAPFFMGVANPGGIRGDVAAIYGPQFLGSGYSLIVNGLAPGNYEAAVFARSRITGTFAIVQTVRFTIAPPPQNLPPRMSIDSPGNAGVVGTTFWIGGWAIDPNTTSGSGVDAIHVYASPNPGSGTPPRFVGVATLGTARPDVAAAFGPSGAASGYGLVASLPPGYYELIVFARSRVTGTFNNALAVRVTVR